MSDFITTKEAAKLLNTTDRTIRRKLSAMSVQCPNLVQYVRKEGKTILIDKRLVLGNFERIEEQSNDIKEPEATAAPEKIELILLQQLSAKDKQIEGLQKHIGELTERNREQNIIIIQMQEQKRIEAEREQEQIRIEATKEQTTATVEQPTAPPLPKAETTTTTQSIVLALLLIILLGVLLIWLNTF